MCPHCTTALPNAVSGSVDRAKQGKRFTGRKKFKSHADISNVQIGHRHSVRATHTHTHFPGFHYISPVYCCSAKYFWNLTHAQKVISQSPHPPPPTFVLLFLLLILSWVSYFPLILPVRVSSVLELDFLIYCISIFHTNFIFKRKSFWLVAMTAGADINLFISTQSESCDVNDAQLTATNFLD